MMQIEIQEKAKELWPRSTPAEISLLTKIFSNTTAERASSILEEARIDSQYQTLPLKDIKRRAGACGSTGNLSGRFIDCWAVDTNGKYKMCAVLASTSEGAKVQMEKYLQSRCNVDPSFYTIIVEDFKAFWAYRMQTLGFDTKINPEPAF
jgi:hypothetical protein